MTSQTFSLSILTLFSCGVHALFMVHSVFNVGKVPPSHWTTTAVDVLPAFPADVLKVDTISTMDITPAQQIVSSCSGAVLTSLFMTPLDVVKIRLQAQHKPFRSGSCFVYSNGLMDCLCVCSHCNETNGSLSDVKHSQRAAALSRLRPWYERPGQFTGTLVCTDGHFSGTRDAFVKITRNEGLAALWSGLPPTLILSVPATVIYYTMYDRFKYALGYKEADPSTKYIPLVAGSGARMLAAVFINPIELIRTKMQSMRLGYGQLFEAIKVSFAAEGFGLVFKGLGPALLRDVPFSAMYWYGYELCKSQRLRATGNTTLTFSETFASGALSGTVAAVITLPFDVIKTHRQIELGEALFSVDGGKKSSSSTWALIGQLYRHHGLSALYAGIVPRVVKVAPACAIMISTYEFGKSFFQRRNAMQSISSES